ncbi:urease accessory protein UreD [Streptomyces sp. 549]|uniref:urease accessory protein UreD n=1 Tax=Streptomyces sp. 549 TaxID=3049076 RepID=UPI0024C42F4B|nr:urease accessory protein UreD [Streptomyces sp. 549]MDK1474568.1 urease accessory protein UreD [Streptomyces sp. 549]
MSPDAGGVTATARVTAAPGRGTGTALPELAGDGPLALRRVRSAGPYAAVALVGAMTHPLGGDRLRLETDVRPGAALRFTTTAATVALPGREGGAAYYDTVHRVGAGATLHWLPEPVISARGSDLRADARVDLDADARLVFREEQVLGRTGETTGRLTTRLSVHRAGRPLLDQELSYGPGVPGWDDGAVLGGMRAVGQLLVVDPAFAQRPVGTEVLPGTAVRCPLDGPAFLVSAVAQDALRLRRALDELATGLVPPCAPHGHPPGGEVRTAD